VKRWLVPSLCATLGVIFYVQGWLAVRGKSPTVDEPLHAVGAYLHAFDGDFRINPEDPPIWNYWAMIPHRRGALAFDFDDPSWAGALHNTIHEATFTTRALFQDRRNDGALFINRSRAVMLLLGAALLGVLVLWSWRLAGPVAGAAAGLLYCFDPNFLAHAPLVKNDVSISLVMLVLSAAVWSVGRRITWWNALLPGIVVGVGLSTKFSGVLLPPMLGMMLLGRALLSDAWPTLRWRASGAASRLAAAAAVFAASLVVAWGVVWAAYGFRFDATRTAGVRLPLESQVEQVARNQFLLTHQRYPSAVELARWRPGIVARAVLWLDANRVMPHAWIYGFTYTYQSTQVRSSYLLGEHRVTGWWYYFPLAILFKTPIATLAAGAIALIVWLSRNTGKPPVKSDFDEPSRIESEGRRSAERLPVWSLVCIAVPFAVYGISAVTTNLNLGLRHVLPLYPFIYVAIGIAASAALRRYARAFIPVASILGLGLMIESLASFPNYLAFFNAPSRPHRLELLSDSNFDWGQDLPLLAEWVRNNPGQRLYLAYFGTADPAFYGITDYVHIPGGFWLGPPVELPDPSRPGVMALSGNILQGNLLPPPIQQLYAPYRQRRPRAVLGDSIYIFDFP
jgi:hypothetical protein